MSTRHRLAVATLSLLTLMAISNTQAQAAADSPTAAQLAERMLTALGGRDAWARLTNLVNDSEQHRATEPTVVRAVITLDLTRPRFRIETTAPDLHVIRVIDAERDWRLSRTGSIEAVPADTRAGDVQWYAGHVYRTIHRIARRDPALRLETDASQRLLVYEGATRIAWYKLDARYEPYAFGAHQDEVGSLAGRWLMQSVGIKHPAWTSSADGTWRAQLVSLAVNVPLGDELFARPSRVVSFEQLAGDWRGEGEFRGKATAIALAVRPVLGSQFHELQLALSPTPQAEPIFSGFALYQRALDGLQAQWFDSSGNQYAVRGRIDGVCLHAQWTTANRASARSSYCVDDNGKLVVTDAIATTRDEWRTFGRYTLQRTP